MRIEKRKRSASNENINLFYSNLNDDLEDSFNTSSTCSYGLNLNGNLKRKSD